MIKSRRVLLDVDGVLANFHEPALKVAQSVGVLHPEATHEWDIFRHYDRKSTDKIYDILRGEGWCASLEPYEGAQMGVLMLSSVADVYFVTAPMAGRHWPYERAEWLRKHFGAGNHNIIQTHAKHVCTGDVFVDDKPAHVEDWMSHNPQGTALLWDQPYNQRSHYLPRVDAWEQVVDAVRGIR